MRQHCLTEADLFPTLGSVISQLEFITAPQGSASPKGELTEDLDPDLALFARGR